MTQNGQHACSQGSALSHLDDRRHTRKTRAFGHRQAQLLHYGTGATSYSFINTDHPNGKCSRLGPKAPVKHQKISHQNHQPTNSTKDKIRPPPPTTGQPKQNIRYPPPKYYVLFVCAYEALRPSLQTRKKDNHRPAVQLMGKKRKKKES